LLVIKRKEMMKDYLFVFLLCLPLFATSQERNVRGETFPLYADSIPNSTGYFPRELIDGDTLNPVTYQKVSRPTMTAYFPDKAKQNGTAVIVFPGGAYTFLAYQEEGTKIAQNLVKEGICAFVVKYRLPDELTMEERSIGPLQDAQQAILTVRKNAREWGIDTAKVGVMGFSAGGHLASTVGTHFNRSYIANPTGINLRPDFMILVYPVISMADSLTHAGSRTKLFGVYPTPEQLKLFSNELQVSDQTPPCYITQTEDDRIVSVMNSIVFYQALLHHHVPAEMHLFPKGDHGFVLRLPAAQWMAPLYSWMRSIGKMQ
jgi:acetyl esterase/lipase